MTEQESRRKFLKFAGASVATIAVGATALKLSGLSPKEIKSIPKQALNRFWLDEHGSLRFSSNAGPSNADPSFGANGVGFPSVTVDPSPLPSDGYKWYRSDLKGFKSTISGAAQQDMGYADGTSLVVSNGVASGNYPTFAEIVQPATNPISSKAQPQVVNSALTQVNVSSTTTAGWQEATTNAP